MRREIRKILDSTADRESVTFLSLFTSARDISAELDSCHTARIASMLGGINIAETGRPARGQKRISLSLERIVEAGPDIILITTMGQLEGIRERMQKELESSPAWNGLEAVREGKVYYLPSDLFLYKPNQRFPEAFEHIAAILYPEE